METSISNIPIDKLDVTNLPTFNSIQSYNIPAVSTAIPVMPAPSADPGFFGGIWNWITLDPVRIIFVLLAAGAAYKLWKNYQNKESDIGIFIPVVGILATFFIIGPNFGWLPYGLILGIASLSFLVQSCNYPLIEEEVVPEKQQQPIQAPQRPTIRPAPVSQPTAFSWDSGFSIQPPKIGLNLKLF